MFCSAKQQHFELFKIILIVSFPLKKPSSCYHETITCLQFFQDQTDWMGDKDHQLTKVHSTTFPSRQNHTYVGFPSSREWDCHSLSAKTLPQLLSAVCGAPSSPAPSTVLLLPRSVVTLSSNNMVNNVNVTRSVSWSLLRRREETPQLHFPGQECCLAAASWNLSMVWHLCRAAILSMPEVWCFCRCSFWTMLMFGGSLCGNQPQISSQCSRTVLNCGTSRRYNRELVYILSQHKDHTVLLENSLNVPPCVFVHMEFISLDAPAVGTSATT